MDAKRFDAIVQELSAIATRRTLLRLVVALLPVGALATLLEDESASGNGAWVGGGGRRRRRRRDHHTRRRRDKHKKKNKGNGCEPACTCPTCNAETPCPDPCICHGTAAGGTCSTACIPTGEGLCFVSGECCDFDSGGAICGSEEICCPAVGASCADAPCCNGLTCCPGIDLCLTQCPS